MKTEAKVVHIGAPSPASTPAASPLPLVLAQVRDKAAQQLRGALQALFDNADDSLFEMADRALSNAEQNAFFEAMRDLRLKRKGIEREFLHKMLEAFASLNQYQLNLSPSLDKVSFDSLALVQNDALEESVAVESMVAKVLARDAAALNQFSARLNVIVTQKLDSQNNPLGPSCLSGLFLDACAGLGVEIKVKLIILKLFEKYVLSELDQLYAEANQALIAAGVLPELKSTPPARRPATRPATSTAGNRGETPVAADGEAVQEVFGALQSLLAQVRSSAPSVARPADALPISSDDLLRLLSHLQQRAPQVVSGEADVREQLHGLLQRASAKAGKTRVVGEVDEDVINLVSMLFEFILDDRSLPDSLKALIARLQIPMLKVAVLDKTFFGRGSHPARRLLNEIASAALGWSEQGDQQRDSLYQKIEQVVQRLLNDFVDDPQIFSELLADFIAYTGDERRRSELLEQRTRDAEEGSAKAALARREVEQALNQRLVGKTLPQVVVRLLQEAWSQVLLLTCLKHGAQSSEWQAVLRVMDELIWSLNPALQTADRSRVLALLPGLLRGLREGLDGAAVDPFVSVELLSQLRPLHRQVLLRLLPPIATPDSSASAAPELASAEVNTAPASVTAAGEPAERSDVVAEMDYPPVDPPPQMVEVVEEIVLLAPGEVAAPETPVILADDDEALQQVDNLHVGSWLEFQQDAEHKLRCKLAAVIKPTGKYIFVNRTGIKVLEKTRMGLAVEFRRQAIRLLDDALLFDRALESVIGNLRRLKGA
ncbi:DUF1631 domain-containing protein [Pseudomonas sp. 5P_3.1_Bac2]|uniref:DUF1631 domain-containing protein n=1 Tax=Pseudomonas sp. 5P_3.1_Bac2 TaxID=2971617 RepID=UPI0021C5B0BE|nr:DUF1631 domain-containing protein [Pseudomonas sp. 5P_3.1_Bac2]MCU1718117.1 DUF1631 domain-containing protein [Pseudomonas sp. 5P_3.1_Bac2]